MKSKPHRRSTAPFQELQATATATALSPEATSLCRYLAATWAVLLIIGPFFTGHLRPDDSMRGRASMLANMRYHTSVIIVLFQSLGALAGASHSASKLGGFAHRIVAMQDISRTIAQGTYMLSCSCMGYLIRQTCSQVWCPGPLSLKVHAASNAARG